MIADVNKPSIWENREGSKRSSPLPDEQPFQPTQMPLWREQDDPVTSSVIDLPTARLLYTLSATLSTCTLPGALTPLTLGP